MMDSQKALNGKRAAKHDVTSSIRYFHKMFPDIKQKERKKEQVKTYLCTNGAAIACAHGIVIGKDANLLSTNGGHSNLSKHWAKSFTYAIREE